MAWKPKEKPLTLEEAVALARKDLAPFWSGSEPLLAGVRGESGRVTAYPLSDSFAKRNWVILFLDPTSFSGGAALAIAREWHRRYSALEIGFLIALWVPYAALRNPESLEPLLPKQQLPFPVVLDSEMLLAAAFGVKALPKVLLLGAGKPVFESAGPHWFHGETMPELELQRFLRASDPGLPLQPPLALGKVPEDVDRIDFGNGKPGQVSDSVISTIGRVALKLSGPWSIDENQLIPGDVTSRILFSSPAPNVAIIAQALSKGTLTSDIAVEVNGRATWEGISGDDIQMAEDGSSIVRVLAGRMYQILQQLTSDERAVSLSFPSAREVPIGIYGLRFGK